MLAFPPPWRYGPRLAGKYHLTPEQENLREEALVHASGILREVNLHMRKDIPSIDVQVLKTWSPRDDGRTVDAHAICIPAQPEADGEQWCEIRLWWWEGGKEDRDAIGLGPLLRHELAHWYCEVEGLSQGHGSAWMLVALGFGCELDEVVRGNILSRAFQGEEWEDDSLPEINRALAWYTSVRGDNPPLAKQVDKAYERVLDSLRQGRMP